MGENCRDCGSVNIVVFNNKDEQSFRAFDFASGIDIRADKNYSINPDTKEFISTGLRLVIPVGYEGQIRSRSGLAGNKNIFVLNAPGTIDCDYRGEIVIILYNLGRSEFKIYEGNRIAQLVIAPVPRVKFQQFDGNLEAFLSEHKTKRGEQGLGSTGM